MPLITVTGATGKIGSALSEQLLENGVTVRAVARNADKLAALSARGAEARAGDVGDTAFLTEAFRGADGVFVLVPPLASVPDLRAAQREIVASLTEAIQSAGVSHVVALSSQGGGLPEGTGPIVGLHDMEESLKTVPGISVVALRPAFFMENLLTSIPLIKNAGINGSPAGADVELEMIATPDIAAAAAEYLANPTFTGYAVRDLLGPRAYTHREATAILGAAIGRPDLPYVEFPYDDFRQTILGFGFSPSVADAYIDLYRAYNEERIQRTVTRSAENTTPTTLEAFAREVFAPAYGAG